MRVNRVDDDGLVADPLREALLASHDLCSNPCSPCWLLLLGAKTGSLSGRAPSQAPAGLVDRQGHIQDQRYTVSAFLGLLIWWADREGPYTPTQMDAIFQQLTLPGVLVGLGLTDELTRSGGSGALV
jgi:hypothetical protein